MLELKLLDSPTKHQSFLIAAACGHLSIVQQLISTGEVDINYKRSPTRRTALHLACQNGHGDVVECLLQASVDSKAQDWRMSTPFHLAAANGTTEVIGALLKYRAPFYALYDADKLTAQQVALRCGHFALSATLNAPVGMKK
jgi:ankyrin repeat protein